jgi:hypothetical protein
MNTTRIYLYAGILLALTFACKSSQTAVAPAPDPAVGTWQYLVSGTPNGDYPGTFMIKKEGDAYSGEIGAEGQFVPLRDVVVEGNTLSANFDFMGMFIAMKGELVGDTYKGQTTVDYMSFPITAQRTAK